MPCDRPAPILVEQAPRELPSDTFDFSLHGAPPVCRVGAQFADELYRDRRISSVEWRVLREAIWPRHSTTGAAALQVKPEIA